jgi:hypothetical protein
MKQTKPVGRASVPAIFQDLFHLKVNVVLTGSTGFQPVQMKGGDF